MPCVTAGARSSTWPTGPDSLVWLDPGDVDRPDRLAGRGPRRPVGAAPLRRCRAGGRRRPARRRPDLDVRQGRLRRAGGRARPDPGAGRPPVPAGPGGARSWGIPAGTSLYDQKVTILGGGGIATSLLEQLAPFRVDATVVRRTPGADGRRRPGAAGRRPSRRARRRPGGRARPCAHPGRPPASSARPSWTSMPASAWLVNVARGRHVDTGGAGGRTGAGSIAGAALDVTDPEPLPDGHPLWDLRQLHRHAAHGRHHRDGGAAAGRRGSAPTWSAWRRASPWWVWSTRSAGY